MAIAEQTLTSNSELNQARFEFQGVDINDNPIRMYVYAADEDQAEAKLTRAKIDVSALKHKERRMGRKRRRLTREQLGTFAIQLSERCVGGQSIIQAIFDISRATNNPLLREALSEVYGLIKTESLNVDEAFAHREDVFPEAFRDIVRVGSIAGDPSEMLSKYGKRQQLTAANLAKIKGALIYPSVVLAVAGLVVVLLAYFVLPGLASMYDTLLSASGGKLPILTRALLAFSDFLLSWLGLFTMAASVLVIIFIGRWAATQNGKEWLQRHSIRWPLIGSLLRQFHAAHVIDLMSILAALLTSQ